MRFKNILDDSKRKPNKIWVDKGSEFYNRSMKSWLGKNEIKINSIYKEGKSVVSERLIGTFKNRIYKCTTSVWKNFYIDKLDNIVNEYNNTYHRTIKMKPADLKNDTCINVGKEINDKDPKFTIGDHVRISKYKSIFF